MEKSAAERALDEYFATTWKSDRPTCMATLEKLREEHPLARVAFEYAWAATALYVHPHAREIVKTLGGEETKAARVWGKDFRALNLERVAYEMLHSLETFEFPSLPSDTSPK